jgi:hypothetical protein
MFKAKRIMIKEYVKKYFENKNQILTYLLVIAIILLFINVLTDKFIYPEKLKLDKQLSVSTVNKIFEIELKDFRIDSLWIKKKKIKNNRIDSLTFIYKVRIPKDLPVILVLSEINKKFNYPSVKINSREKKLNKATLLSINNNNMKILQAELEVDTNIVRKSVSFGFIVKDIDKMSKSELLGFLNTPEEFCAILVPSVNSEFIKDKIVENQKEYLILLNDDLEDQKYKFDEKFSKQRLQNSLREILLNFKEAKLYLFDPNSDLCNSTLFGYIKKEFDKRKIKLIPINKFKSLAAKGDNALTAVFKSKLNEKSESKVYLVNIDDFNSLQNEIINQRLKGNKLVFPSVKKFGIE